MRIVLGVLGLALLAAVVIRLRVQAGDDVRTPVAGKPERQTAVLVAAVERKDMPIELEGIGSAAALMSVTIRPQVDGRITKVFFTEGQPVKAGELLAQIDPRPYQIALQQAEANFARDKATLESNQGNYDRLVQLQQGHFVATQDVSNQKALVGQGQASLLGDQAAIDNAKLNLSYARITSPIDGVAGIRLIDPGNYVRAGDTNGLVILTQLDPIAVVFSLPQDDLPKIAAELARTGTLPVVAFDREGLTELAHGELRVIDNQVVSATATLRLKAVFPNAERKLWPNLFVKARLLLETRKDALVVPSTAIQRGPRGPFVYVVGSDQTAQVRMIKVELMIAEEAVIASGLQPGEQVVIEGQNQLRPGAKVQLRTGTPKLNAKPPDSLK
ncbi:MAG TPA: efflux RND transporter periplasmic adaptor subunit [Polyangiales bacterium]|nr:efflux RND transporter periplasmic adaptor subunit [Polyangiales bacterium]